MVVVKDKLLGGSGHLGVSAHVQQLIYDASDLSQLCKTGDTGGPGAGDGWIRITSYHHQTGKEDRKGQSHQKWSHLTFFSSLSIFLYFFFGGDSSNEVYHDSDLVARMFNGWQQWV